MSSRNEVIESIYNQMKDPTVTQEQFENLSKRLELLQRTSDK